MSKFDKTKEYYFVGKSNLIEGTSLYVDSQIVYLGKFLGYVAVPWGGDWITDGKAMFETGTLSKGQYENIYLVKAT
jgi:hypothetical protein